MESEIQTVEQRVKSFMGQLQTECGILERLVYKHKNQHRRSSYFQYILKVRRDLKLLKLAKLEEVFDASFVVINGNRPKQKLQLLESLKRRRCDSDKYNFLERLLGVARLLSEMVEPMLRAAMEISTLLAQSFFMKFSLTVLAVLARIRVLVQQMLLDAVHVYNAVSTLSQKEQTVKLNQDGFEVFREYYPKKEEAIVVLECLWQTDKYVLVERINEIGTQSMENDVQEHIPEKILNIQYQNIEVVLGVDEFGATDVEHVTVDPGNAELNESNLEVKNYEKHVDGASDTIEASCANIVAKEDVIPESSQGVTTDTDRKRSNADCSFIAVPPEKAGLPSSSNISPLLEAKTKHENKKKKVAFVSVKPPAPSTATHSRLQTEGTEKSGRDKDPFYSLLAGGNKNSFI